MADANQIGQALADHYARITGEDVPPEMAALLHSLGKEADAAPGRGEAGATSSDLTILSKGGSGGR